ncbi:MAG: cell wall-binding repeat-containing protein [Actinomycetota bacterium]|nr:cell wall-binding repeat-containing protein [Actinomycetota bacterium]
MTAGATTTGVDASLDSAGSISGRIYDRWTDDPAYAYVYLYDAMDGLGELHEVAWKDTPDGDYAFEGLPEWSDYVVAVDPPGPLGMRYYDDTDDPGSATPFGVLAGEDVTGIDIPLDITPDSTAPGTHDDALALYYNAASIEVTASDDLSGVEQIEYRLDAEATATVAATSTVVATSAEGSHTLRYRAKDRAGNYSDLVVRDFDVVYDTTPPELDYAGWEAYQSAPHTTIEMFAVDDISGVARLSWRMDGAATKTVDADYYGEVIGGHGAHTLRFWAEDIAGNVSDDILLEFFLDEVVPTATDDAEDYYTTSPAQFTVTGDDGVDGSGIEHVRYRIDGAATQTVDASLADIEVTGEGDHEVEYWVVDMAGNESDHGTASFVIDLTDPTISHDGWASAWYPRAAAITVEADDAGSLLRTLRWQVDGGPAETLNGPASHLEDIVVAGLGAHTLHIWAEDMAGNTSEDTFDFEVFEPDAGRVADSTRYSTAVAIAREGFDPGGEKQWPGVVNVVIASGDDRAAADPLAASGLCWAYDAPLFLVKSTSVPSEVATAIREIARARSENIAMYVVGGPVSVPDARVNDIVKAVGSAEFVTTTPSKMRILSSGGRYDLAKAIALCMRDVAAADPEKTMPSVALFANGADPAKFFDALALSPIAAHTGAPILLVQQNSVPSATSSAVGALGPATRIVGGGSATVSETVRKKLGAQRWAGDTRYSTATAIADKAIAKGWLGARTVGVAAKLPDALTGGSMVGASGGVLVLTDGKALTPITGSWLAAHRKTIDDCYVFGGTMSVDPKVLTAIKAKIAP